MGKLEEFWSRGAEPEPQNALLRSWLFEDDERAAFYAELGAHGFPVLRFRSAAAAMGGPGPADVYLVSSAAEVGRALREGSVKPYADLDSGGSFMLGIDADQHARHGRQRQAATKALAFTAGELDALAREAIRRAAILPLKQNGFNLPTDLAQEAALRYAELVFGLGHLAHRYLRPYMAAVYTRLTFQIIGRHFVLDAGLPPKDSERAKTVSEGMRCEVPLARTMDAEELRRRKRRRLPEVGAIQRLYEYRDLHGGLEEGLLVDMVVGLIGGTIGNLQAAVTIAIADFFRAPTGGQDWGIDQARAAAADPQGGRLEALIMQVLMRQPPAPFLARTHLGGHLAWRLGPGAEPEPVPEGATLLLAMGAEPKPEHLFGGLEDGTYMHQCVGRHLAMPLIRELVRFVVQLPGLRPPAKVPKTAEPNVLKKRWGSACERYWLEYRRDRRLYQQPLHVALPLKEPYAESAEKLQALTKGGAFIVQDALDGAKHVHFAWFMLVEQDGRPHLAMMTAYDGDFDAYVEHFATDVSLFDEQLKYLEGAPEPPVKKNAKAFVDWIRKHNRPPMGGFFYSAYPTATASRIAHAFNPKEDDGGRP